MNKLILGRIGQLTSFHIYVIIFYFSAFMMLYITSFGMYWSWVEYKTTGTISIGETIVKNDLFFNGSGKLVTYLAIFSVLSWFCVTKIGSKKVERTPKIVKDVFGTVAVILIVVSAYEFVYNFTVWGSLITFNLLHQPTNPDEISIKYPNPKTPWNLDFATKMTLAAFIISCHSFYVIHKSYNRADKKQW
ncbi:MAG: hypothetical protein ACTHL3_00625 [Candidatus Nitrosocosmicus sp.]